ncbi:MAG: cyclic nucleotide-binding domain-containing protein [Gammaproteobacteria bacterium]|nr:cyclic nucleotide-binding domain-containing protein [Gammaproteobacteria bacterium]
MSEASVTKANQVKEDVKPFLTEKITRNSAGEKVVISKTAQMLFSQGAKKNFLKDQYIIREGHSDKTVFILLSGEVEVLKKDKEGVNQVVAKLSEGGTILGEMSIFLDEPRSSSVRISKDAVALAYTGEKFLTAVINTPDLALRILKSLSSKLKATSDNIVSSAMHDTGINISKEIQIEEATEGSSEETPET